MGHDVFISHSSKDKAAADAVCAALEANGVRCWVAPRDIKPGENWATSILHGIAECRMMVVVFSEHTNGSQQIPREVERAVHRGIPIAPLRVQDVMPRNDLEYFLSSSHWMDALTPPLEQHLREFTQKVRGLLGIAGEMPPAAPALSVSPPPTATPPATRPVSTGRKSGRLAALLIALLIALSAAWAFRADLRRLVLGTPEQRPTTQPSIGIPALSTPIPATPSTAPTTVAATAPTAPPPPETAAATARREQAEQLKTVQDLFLANRITPEQYKLGQLLLKSAVADVDEYDAARREQFLSLAQGRLAPDKLADALNAIESPDQKAARLAREEMERKDALRLDRITHLLAAAQGDQTAEKGVEGLALIAEVLKLDPSNADAISVKTKIESILADAQRQRDEQQRRQRVASLLQQARDLASAEKYDQASAIVVELLRLDPANAEACGIKEQLDVRAKNFTNTVGMKFTRIEPGEFLMGSPASEADRGTDETQHKVKLTKPFFLGTYHVTRGQFAAFVKDAAYRTDAEKDGWAYAFDGTKLEKVNGASWEKPGFDQTDDHPVVEVSWNDATAFCKWLSAKEGKNYRLPTEAEWEYACRAGTNTAYFWGDNPDGGQGFANCADLTAKDKFPVWNDVFNWGDGFVFTSPVGSFKPNPWGLYDMIGNAWEWCSDFYGPYADGDAFDPTGPVQGNANTSTSRVLRGGSWSSIPEEGRAACRNWYTPVNKYTNYSFGFRVCLDF